MYIIFYVLTIMSNIPIVKPVNVKEYEFKQSKYEVAPRLPFSQIITGPSGSGKGILLQSMILDIYKDVFARIYVWSPSISVDANWLPVRRYIQNELKVDLDKEKVFFDEYNPSELEEVINRQHKIIEYQKKNNHNKLHSILIIVDDFADSKAFSRNSPLLNQLYVRGRHNAINIITSTQKCNALSPIIRVNSRQLFFFRLRNYKEIETMVEELSAVLIKKSSVADTKNLQEAKTLLLEVYNLATEEPYSFLFINLMKPDVNNMFYKRFDAKLIID